MSKSKEPFKPVVPADQTQPELTVTSVILGIVLAVVFGAANAYLGLRVGLTISASIPAAVISMGIVRVILRKKSILENNMVQTIGSAGESLAAGAIFTLPALFLWAEEGKMETPGMLEIAILALCGGLLGTFFMIPLRRALIVQEHGVLPYPEGSACAKVLIAGDSRGTKTSSVFIGMGIGALVKWMADGIRVVSSEIVVKAKGYAGEFSAQAYPALIGVGYICGARISACMFAGGVMAWLVLIPMIVLFAPDTVLFPGTEAIRDMYAAGGASAIWSNYIRYIGAGGVAAGGLISLCRSIPMIVRTFRDSVGDLRRGGREAKKQLRTNRDLNMGLVLASLAVLAVLIWLMPQVPVSFGGALLVVLFGFVFAAVSSRVVGLVGSSNNPVSGMTIAALLVTTLVLKLSGMTGSMGMKSAIAIGSIVCIVAAMAGDTSQDLKTGFLVGATPAKQQIGELIGSVAAALAIGGVLYLLHLAWGFGSEELGAPQATLMKMIVEGIMEENLPWTLIIIGVFIAVVIEILGVSVLPFAVGLYLPIGLTSCVMIGGLVRLFAERKRRRDTKQAVEERVNNGILYCSGLIAGEGLIGVLLAVLTLFAVPVDLSGTIYFGTAGTVVLLAIQVALLVWFGAKTRKARSGNGVKM